MPTSLALAQCLPRIHAALPFVLSLLDDGGPAASVLADGGLGRWVSLSDACPLSLSLSCPLPVAMSAAASAPPSSVSDDLVDDSLSSSHDIVADRGLTAAPAKKGLSKDKEKALAEEAVDKVKAGAEERDEDNSEDSQLSIAQSSRGKRQLLGSSSSAPPSAASSGESDADLAAYLKTASESVIFADLSVRFEDTRAEADQTFVLLGDALLLQLLNDRLTHWSPPTWRTEDGAALACGGQFLHVMWAFEHELAKLAEGGRQCRVLWLDEVGAAVTSVRSDYSALRRLLHLHVAAHCRVLQDSFSNWWTEEFAAFLERVDPAFLIVGDGHDSAYESHPPTTSDEGDEGEKSSSPPSPPALMRSLTLFLLSRNFRCIRLSELTSTANGVFAFQYQMPIEVQHELRKQPRIPRHTARDDEKASGGDEKASKRWADVQKAVASLPSLPSASPCSRLALTSYALALSLSEETPQALSASVPLSKAVLLHSVLLSSSPCLRVTRRTRSSAAVSVPSSRRCRSRPSSTASSTTSTPHCASRRGRHKARKDSSRRSTSRRSTSSTSAPSSAPPTSCRRAMVGHH